MARVSYETGIQCKECGHMFTKTTIHTSELCQNCGAHVLNIDLADRSCTIGPQGRWIVVKVTHKLFQDILEFVKEL